MNNRNRRVPPSGSAIVDKHKIARKRRLCAAKSSEASPAKRTPKPPAKPSTSNTGLKAAQKPPSKTSSKPAKQSSTGASKRPRFGLVYWEDSGETTIVDECDLTDIVPNIKVGWKGTLPWIDSDGEANPYGAELLKFSCKYH